MRERSSWFRVVVLAFLLCLGVTAWAAPGRLTQPHRYLPGGQDGRLVMAANPLDGSVWSAWAYRNGWHFDLAIAVSHDGGSVWSEPTLIGVDDDLDQIQPAITIDGAGSVYIAFVQGSPGRVFLLAFPAGTTTVGAPIALTPLGENASSPALRIVGQRLVAAFNTPAGVRLIDLPLDGISSNGAGFTDGPDPVGNSGDEDDESDDEFTGPGALPDGTIGDDSGTVGPLMPPGDGSPKN